VNTHCAICSPEGELTTGSSSGLAPTKSIPPASREPNMTVLAEMREKLKQLKAPQTTEKDWVGLRFATLFADSGNDMERIDELREQARSDASTLYAQMATLAENLSRQIEALTEALLLSEDFLNGQVSSALSAVSACQPVEGSAAPSSKRQKS
jgi:hypothetical protein